MTTDLESRIRQLEDRALISERVIKYAMSRDAVLGLLIVAVLLAQLLP
ncbi:MAG: hypothetical protein M3O73_00590 [Actinomycetota bacterium]|nr:hypothetical protein [Actinomycetota bacterium]